VSDTGSLLAAILAVQAEAPTLKKNATNPHFKSRFAPLDTIVETIGPLLAKNGLVWLTKPSFDETSGEPTLKYKLAHAPSKEAEEGEMKLLLSKGDPQGQGSAITYARRYALCSVLNLVADDDDDGARAAQGRRQGPAVASDAQKKRLRTDITKYSLTADEVDVLFKGAGFQRGEGEKVNDAIERLTAGQVSTLIDTLSQGAVKTGGSDVPSDDGFTHPPAEPDPVLS
jgi:hypothetical protein